MAKEVLKIKRLNKELDIPEYINESDVGFDLRAAENKKIYPGAQETVKTGIIIEIPQDCVGLIRDRVGIVTKMNVHTVAGTFDSAYRGEVSVVLVNLAEEEVLIEEGMRIAQMIILPVIKPKIIEVKELKDTSRGDNGFGSTGIKEIHEIEKIIKNKCNGKKER
jgi:dUTP pyrophosphatase